MRKNKTQFQAHINLGHLVCEFTYPSVQNRIN